MEENKYHFAREVIFTLRACHAISEKVFLHWIDKLIKDEIDELIKSGQLDPNGSYHTQCECGYLVHSSAKNCKKCGLKLHLKKIF